MALVVDLDTDHAGPVRVAAAAGAASPVKAAAHPAAASADSDTNRRPSDLGCRARQQRMTGPNTPVS